MGIDCQPSVRQKVKMRTLPIIFVIGFLCLFNVTNSRSLNTQDSYSIDQKHKVKRSPEEDSSEEKSSEEEESGEEEEVEEEGDEDEEEEEEEVEDDEEYYEEEEEGEEEGSGNENIYDDTE